nr:reverse transcriptase domain-containing protein [Tanacetum cinerariifolium]GEZ01361.1 reverse transcriptase domain-containing protein [Tanacetum cinerariifolium]
MRAWTWSSWTDRLFKTQTTIPISLLLVNFPSIGLTLDDSKVPDAKLHASYKSPKVSPLDALHNLTPCMRTRLSYFPPTSTIPRRSRKQTTNVVEPEFHTIVEMADNRTMAQMLQAPIEVYRKTRSTQPSSFFNKVTSTFRHPETKNLRDWEDLVSKFINQFFPPSKTTYLRNKIPNFLQKPNETFNEAWECFKDLLRQYPHHGFSELCQLDTFYNALNPNDQDALDSAAGGNFLDKILRECLSIIESKSKVRYSRSRVTDVRANANAPLSSSSPSNSFDLQEIAASRG